jgi:hypothetical protein
MLRTRALDAFLKQVVGDGVTGVVLFNKDGLFVNVFLFRIPYFIAQGSPSQEQLTTFHKVAGMFIPHYWAISGKLLSGMVNIISKLHN